MKHSQAIMFHKMMRNALLIGLPVTAWNISSHNLLANTTTGQTGISQQTAHPKHTLTGVVKDETGLGLPGVSVVVKGTTIGTITNIDGEYTLDIPQNSEIIFSYIGYKAQTVSTTGKKIINIDLAPDQQNLDEVVVIGYGTVKKRDLTGSVVSVKAEDIALTPASNAMEALQGKVAGMDIVKSSGQAGADVEINVRGTRSIYGDNTPLFIIDGIAGNYNQINPSDIESIEILKDASSTAIYGSAGANGVVIITTKKGKEGKATVNFDARIGMSGFAEYPSGMVGDEYLKLKKEAYRGNKGSYPEFMSSIFTDVNHLEAYESGKWIDFVDEVIGRKAVNQDYNVSISGGTDKTKVFASLNYNDEKGLLKGDDRLRYGLRMNIDQTLWSWAKAGINANLNYTRQNRRNQSVFVNALTFVPLGDCYDENGKINVEYIPGEQNPMSDEIDGQYVNNNKGTYVAANGYLDLTPFKGFSFRSLIGVISANSRTGMFFGPQSIANITAGYSKPLASIDNNYDWSYKWENILNYNFKIAESHDITLTGITSWSHFQHENNYSAAQGQELTSQSFHNLAAGTLKQGLLSSFTQSQAMSYAARINYSYLGRYLLTVSNRWDGVSHLADGHKWDMFPAAALGWRISDEAFMENTQEWLSNLKLRIGYGVTGNSGGMGPYSSKTKTQTFPKPVVFGNASAPVIQYDAPYENPNIGWEKSYNTNIGIDAGFLNGRIDMALDIYHTKTKDLLFKRQLPITAGVTMWGRPITMWQNIGETSNKGIELMLNTRNIIQKNFTWASVLTFTANKEKIEKLPDGDLISESLFLGKPSRAFYDYKYLGIWKENEAETAALYGCVPGDIKLATNPVITKDENGNEVSDNGVHKYSDKDKMFLGAKTPDWYLGFQNNFTFYDFDASIFMMLRVGQTLKSDLITRYNPTTSTVNSPSGIDYYTPENQNAYLPRPGIHGSMSEYYGFGSLAYRDGSFLKIKNITLGYTLPKKVLNAIKMEKIRFYATAYNPLIWAFDSELKGQDPERNGSDNFPLTKEFVFGVNITF